MLDQLIKEIEEIEKSQEYILSNNQYNNLNILISEIDKISKELGI